MICWKSRSALWLILMELSLASSDFFPITATQSGDQLDSSSAAMNAVDNNPSTCSLAAESNVNDRTAGAFGWLQVDLGNPFLVTSVTLTNPTGGNSRYLQNFVILVSNSNSTDVQSSNICAQFNNGSSVAAGATITFQCTNALIGRYVTIERQGGDRQDAISICEVSITRNSSGSYVSTAATTSSTRPLSFMSNPTGSSKATVTLTNSTRPISTDSSTLSSMVDVLLTSSSESLCNGDSSDKVAGLAAAVIVLAILLGLTVIAFALHFVYTLRKKNQDQNSKSLPSPSIAYQPHQTTDYEKLRREIEVGKSGDSSIQAEEQVGDRTYDEVHY